MPLNEHEYSFKWGKTSSTSCKFSYYYFSECGIHFHKSNSQNPHFFGWKYLLTKTHFRVVCCRSFFQKSAEHETCCFIKLDLLHSSDIHLHEQGQLFLREMWKDSNSLDEVRERRTFSLYLLWFIEKSVAVSRQFMGYNMIPLCIARNSYNNLLFLHRQMCYS